MRNRIIIGGLIALALTGCSKKEETKQISSDLKTFDVNDRSPPAIDPTAAPGVAFSYKYDFQLADEKISAVRGLGRRALPDHRV